MICGLADIVEVEPPTIRTESIRNHGAPTFCQHVPPGKSCPGQNLSTHSTRGTKMSSKSKIERDRKAEEFLLAWLEKGPAFVPVVKLAAKRQGVSWASVRLARHTKGVRSVATLNGQIWSLQTGGGPMPGDLED